MNPENAQDEKRDSLNGSIHSNGSSSDSEIGDEIARLSVKSGNKLPKLQKGVDSTMYLHGGRRRSSISVADAVKALNADPHAHVSSLQEGRRAMLCTLTIDEGHEHTGEIENISLLELLRGIEDNIKNTVGSGGADHVVTDRDGIGGLRGRDLCRLTKFGNDSDALVYLVKQHCLIVSFRYDMRAVIESNRITFIAHEGENTSLDRIKMFMLEALNPQAAANSRAGTANGSRNHTHSDAGARTNTHGSVGSVNLQMNVQQIAAVDGLPFEIKCLETMLATVIKVHRAEFEALESNCVAYLNALHGSSLLTTDQQELLRELKEGVGDTRQRVQNCVNMLTDLLSDDVSMAFTMLGELNKSPDCYKHFNTSASKADALRQIRTPDFVRLEEDLEFLLEYHLVECNELESKIAIIWKRLEHAEQSVMVRLSVSQNELLVANTMVTVMACSVGFGSYIAGLFGMNLDQTLWLQPMYGSFNSVVFVSFCFMVLVVVITQYYLKARNILPKKMSLRDFRHVQSVTKVVPTDAFMPFMNSFFNQAEGGES